MKVKIDFEHPYFDEKIIFELTLDDLNCFYADANEVNRLNLFFILEASLHKLQDRKNVKASARCAFLMAYYLFVPLTLSNLAELSGSILTALNDETSEYRQWKERIGKGN